MKRDVMRRADRRGAREGAIVVVYKNGEASRVYGVAEYAKIKELAYRVKPHTFRRARPDSPDPLGAMDGRTLRPLGREEIYHPEENDAD